MTSAKRTSFARTPCRERRTASACRRDTAIGHYNFANLAIEQGSVEEAEGHLAEAVELLGRLRRELPSDLEILNLTAQTYRRVGDIRLASKSYEEARAAYEQALEIASHLAFHNPKVRDYRETHAASLLNLGSAQLESQQGDAALASYEDARDAYAALVQDYPEYTPFLIEQANAQVNLGRTLLWLERPQDAVAPLREAVGWLKTPSVGQGTMRQVWITAEARHYLGMYEWSRDNLSAALAEFESGQAALASWLEALHEHPEYADWNIKNRTAIYALCVVAQQNDEAAQHAEWKAKSESVLETLGQDRGQRLRRGVAQHLHTVARLQWSTQQLPLAVGTLRIACAHWEELASTDEAADEVRQQRATALGDLATLLLDVARQQVEDAPEEAKKSAQEARDLLLPLVEAHPDDEFYRRDLQAAEEQLRTLQPATE